MNQTKLWALALLMGILLTGEGIGVAGQGVRVPAEWEPHAATWMQWPGPYDAGMRAAFADIIRVVRQYEPIRLLAGSEAEMERARRFLAARGVPENNITWHIIPVDNAWMRDNGPVYVAVGGRLRIQDWAFDAWGGNFGDDVGFSRDDRVPVRVAGLVGMAAENRQGYVLERGNLEFNGEGILLANWDCQAHRNPGMRRAEHERILVEAFGLTRVIWAYGHHPDDGTTGHIDGSARFTARDTVAIADTGEKTELDLAVACRNAGLKVAWYPGDPNWLVGNGFVVANGAGEPRADADLRARLKALFPGRKVHLVDAGTIARAGGGIHCVTNDQPRH